MDDQPFQVEYARKAIDEEIAQRVAIHQANVARLKAAAQGAHTLRVAITNQPLVMLAQGDSWFDYPLTGNGLPLVDTDVIAQLRRIGEQPPIILNLAHHGDASTDELSLPKQERLITELRNGANWPKGKPDAILFSAGGNDIAGNNFCIVLDFNDGRANGLNEQRFDGVLGSVEACYRELFAIRDRFAPGVPVFAHCYDFPIPNGAHPVCAGPWLKPSLDFCNWPLGDGTRIVREALLRFRTMLKNLENEAANKFHVVETQGVLAAADWANELHPYPAGFLEIAQKFADALGIGPLAVAETSGHEMPPVAAMAAGSSVPAVKRPSGRKRVSSGNKKKRVEASSGGHAAD
jgi:hypothetical protein